MLVLLVFAATVGTSASAQTDPRVPSLVPGQNPQTAVPAVVDTAVAVFEIPETLRGVVALHALQDTVAFGDVLQIALDFPSSLDTIPDLVPVADVPWLVPDIPKKRGFWARLTGGKADKVSDKWGLAEAEGPRSFHSWRIYRTQPFRIQVGEALSPVITVSGLVPGTGDIAGIRAPRPVGFSLAIILGLLVLLGLVILAAWLVWDRGRRGAALEDWTLPVPAWLTAAIELRDLYWAGDLARGDSRAFLDRLAGVARRFMAARYRVAAQEMTGREIINACAGRGHPVSDPGAFARMIDELDHRRYNPEAATPAWCREQAIVLFEQMGKVRVLPRFTEVPAELLLEGEKAWSELKTEFSGAGNISSGMAGPAATQGSL